MRYWAFTVLISGLGLLCGPSARAQAHIEFIDTGTPKNGAVIMTGWHGVIVRVVLDGGGPITRINLGGANGFGGVISGALAQRWTDPTGQGNYTQTSPGPLTANNSFDSDFNFDSHLLGTPAMYAASSSGFEFFPDGVPLRPAGLVSDGTVGYLASPYIPQGADPIIYGSGGHLGGLLDINPAFQSNAIDAAYVVTDSGFSMDAEVIGDESNGFATGIFQLPEPGVLALSVLALMTRLLKRRPLARSVYRCASIEPFESRLLLTVPAPTGVAATLGENGSATVS